MPNPKVAQSLAPTIYEALEQQLGLKLKPARRKVETVVVDSQPWRARELRALVANLFRPDLGGFTQYSALLTHPALP
jgi:hypothetical protein